MTIGVVRSYNKSFFSFKGNKILIKLTTPVFQIVLRESKLTCISKKVEFRLTTNLDGIEAFVMGKKYDYDQFRRDFLDLKSSFWISATVDTSELQEKLDGIALTCQGKVLFVNDFDSIADCFAEIERYVSQDCAHNKTIIREYCQKNIELLNNQIRLLNQDKYMYSELLNTI